MNTQPTPSLHPRTSLFTVRLWLEEVGADEREVRMQVKHVLSGETHYFREWTELVTFLQIKLETIVS